MTTNNLTEQLKKGELKEGVYWCKITESPYVERVYLPCCDDIIVEVLAPVPSYEEWQSLNELLDSMRDTNKALAHRLNICKELLKRCRDFINYEVPDHCIDDVLIDKIDDVLKK